MSDVEVTPKIDFEKQWAFHTIDIEWVFMVKKLMRECLKDIPEDKPTGYLMFKDGYPLWVLDKKNVPASYVSRMLGVSEEWLQGSTILRLNTQGYEHLPKPTCDYWGTA